MSITAPVFDRIRLIPRPDDFLDRNVGASGEVFYDDGSKSLRVLDGKTRGGAEVLTANNVNKFLEKSGVALITKTLTVRRNTGDTANVYFVDGVENPKLTLIRGYTYIFDQSDQTNLYFPNAEGGDLNAHPLHFSNTGDQGTEYTTNINYYLGDDIVTPQTYENSFETNSIRKVAVTVTTDTPDTLYYYCTAHTGMGNEIAVEDPGGGGSANVVVGDAAPSNPEAGNIWFNSSSGRLYVYVSDVDSSQWVQPASGSNAPNSFANIALADSTQFAASGADTLSFIDGSGIQIDTDPVNKTITISATQDGGDSIGNFVMSNGRITTDDSSAITMVPPVVMASDLTVENTISATKFENTSVGTPEIESASTLTLTAPDGVIINSIAYSSELVTAIDGATGTVDHDYTNSAVFYHTNPAADFTVNLTSVPTDDNRSFSIALIIVQGATARMPNALQIDGTAQSYSTLGGQGLLGTANGVDVVNYTFVRNTADSTGWTVLASTADYI